MLAATGLASVGRDSVLDCGSPLPLSIGRLLFGKRQRAGAVQNLATIRPVHRMVRVVVWFSLPNSTQQFFRGDFNLVRNGSGQGCRRELAVGVRHTYDRDQTARHLDGRMGVELAQAKRVVERPRAFLRDEQMNFHFVFKFQRRFEIALHVHPRPAHGWIVFSRPDGKAERPDKRRLGGFHVAEEIRVMDDARHVRINEFDPADDFELESHVGILDLRFAIYDSKSGAVHPACPVRQLPKHHFFRAGARFRAIAFLIRAVRWGSGESSPSSKRFGLVSRNCDRRAKMVSATG
jgi:hypothetical protein